MDVQVDSPVICQAGPSTLSHRLGMCEVCAITEAKYTCPRCEVKTCCLKCSNIHKKELECDGNRDRAKYIPLNKFLNIDLSNDYKLLEEITRSLEGYKKDPTRRFTENFMILPPHLFKLKKSAKFRKTILKYLPPNFQRHKINSTRLNFSNDTISWHLEWVFTNADYLRLSDTKVDENTKLSSVYSKYLLANEDTVIQERLQFYQAADIPGVRFFMKAEEKPGNKFYELDVTLSIKENLQRKVVIEYPIIHVVLKDHVSCVEIIDADNEEETMETDGNAIVDKLIKNEDSEEIYTSLKNLLFISEYSD